MVLPISSTIYFIILIDALVFNRDILSYYSIDDFL